MTRKETAVMELTIMEMEQVSGGTIEELNEMMRAATKNTALRVIGAIGSYVPGENKAMSSRIKQILKSMKIQAEISLGFAGTGLFQANNKYTSMVDGHQMTHQEVLMRLSSAEQ